MRARTEEVLPALRVLVIGGTGMLGQALCREVAVRGHQAIAASRSSPGHQVDVQRPRSLASLIEACAPDVVVNAAALTNLQACEDDPGGAYLANSRPAALLADLLPKQVRLVQISTDQFYVGDRDGAHDELSPVCLVNEYARTKYAAEAYALTHSGALVVRTNIVGFRGRDTPTFAEWAIQALRSQEKLMLFDDFFTSSVDVGSFASALVSLIELKSSGVLNVASREVASKLAFVEALAGALHVPFHCEVGSVRNLTPRRAESSGLDVSRAENVLGTRLPDLADTVSALAAEVRGAT